MEGNEECRAGQCSSPVVKKPSHVRTTKMLGCMLLDEMVSRMEKSFLHRKQRAGDNELDNL